MDKSKIDYLFQHIDLFGENYFWGFYISKTGDCTKDCDLSCKIHKSDCNLVITMEPVKTYELFEK